MADSNNRESGKYNITDNEEMNNNYISEDILNVFNYRYLELLNNSNIDFLSKELKNLS